MLSSPGLFLGIWILACFAARPVLSAPKDEYAGWFSRRDTQTGTESSSASSLPRPPGVLSSETELKHCVFENVPAIEEEESVVILTETLVIDGCLLDCGSKIIHSTIRKGSIVTVRNGGHVKNCKVALIKEKQLKEELTPDDGLDGELSGADDDASTSGTAPPTVWGTYMATGESTYWATYWAKYTTYIPNTVAGFLCDRGDCVLDNSNCTALERDESSVPSSILIMRECVLVSSGATDVRIQGGLIENNRRVSMYGIAVDAVYNSDEDLSSEYKNKESRVRLFVNNAYIRNQLGDGIVIVGGANTVRITNTYIFNNERDGINIQGGKGLSFFAVIGGTVEHNKMNGINAFQYELQQNSTQHVDSGSVSVLSPTSTEMFISDVSVKENKKDGLKVGRIDDIVIDDAIFEQNGFIGIDISIATSVRLQGVVCKSNNQNGLSIEAESSVVEIANSVFLQNGRWSQKSNQYWKQAGIYMWLPKKVSITNSASNMNAMDGIVVYDVPNLELKAVDTMKNGNNGIQIIETNILYGYNYTARTDYLVGAYYYPWHGDDFHKGDGYLRKMLVPPQSPELGEYNDSDPDVISKHLEWFRKSNIGLLVASWWGPDRIEDNNIRNVLMQHDYIGNLKIALHYETTGRIKEDAGNDMSIPESDIQYMCEHYFDHPNYYKIDGRPVLVIYISRKLEKLGTLESALLTMRSAASKCGHHLYLIGDAVFAKAPDISEEEPFISFRYLDAVTNYDVYGSSGATKQDTPYAGSEAVDAFYAEQAKWRKLAFDANCRYIPPVSPGYNDRGVRIEKDNQPLSRRLTESSDEGSLFKYQLEKALPLVDPEVDNLILVNSFNEWHEDTQIEPIKVISDFTNSTDERNIATQPEELTFGLEYVEYGEIYLDILRNATSRSLHETEDPKGIHKPSYTDFADVRSCKNRGSGMRFYIPESSFDDQPEHIFRPGNLVISCQNWSPDYELLGGGNLNTQALSNVRIVGDQCSNGSQALKCNLADLLITCEKKLCRHRDIVTASGNVIDDHKLQ